MLVFSKCSNTHFEHPRKKKKKKNNTRILSNRASTLKLNYSLCYLEFADTCIYNILYIYMNHVLINFAENVTLLATQRSYCCKYMYYTCTCTCIQLRWLHLPPRGGSCSVLCWTTKPHPLATPTCPRTHCPQLQSGLITFREKKNEKGRKVKFGHH